MKLFRFVIAMTLMLCILMTGCGGVASVDDEYVPVQHGSLPAKDPSKDYSPLKAYDKTVDVYSFIIEYPKLGPLPEMYNGKPLSASNNAFFTLAKDTLNINLRPLSTLSGANYEQRLNAMIGANDVLPDVFITSDPTTFEKLKNAKLIADIAPSYYYLNDDLRGIFDNPVYRKALESCMVDGKLYAFPNVYNPNEVAQRLYIRKDWLEIVNKDVPETYEELIAVAEAFRDNATSISESMTGVKAKDIIPIGITKEIATIGNHTAQGLFNIFSTQPNTFVEKDGKIVDSNTTDEMKTALNELHKMYEKGLMSKEFFTATHAKVENDIIAGKVGIISGMWHCASSPLQQSVNNENTPGAEWVSIDIPAFGGGKAPAFCETSMIQNYCMVSRAFVDGGGDVAVLAKLCNLFHDIFYNQQAEEIYGDLATPEGGFYYSWVPVKIWDVNYSVASFERLWGAFNELYDAGFRISDEKYAEMLDSSQQNGLNIKFDWKNWYKEMSEGEYGPIFNKIIEREKENGFKYGYPFFQAKKQGKKNIEMNAVEKNGYGIYEQNINNKSGFGYVASIENGSVPSIKNAFYGAKTPAQQQYGEVLDTTFKTFALECIRGDKDPLKDFDKFKQTYMSNGGDAVLRQVNQWSTSNK